MILTIFKLHCGRFDSEDLYQRRTRTFASKAVAHGRQGTALRNAWLEKLRPDRRRAQEHPAAVSLDALSCIDQCFHRRRPAGAFAGLPRQVGKTKVGGNRSQPNRACAGVAESGGSPCLPRPGGFTVSETGGRARSQALGKTTANPKYGPLAVPPMDLKKNLRRQTDRPAASARTRRYEPIPAGSEGDHPALVVLRKQKPSNLCLPPVQETQTPRAGHRNPRPIDTHYEAIRVQHAGRI